ncbi:MAG TPA: aminoacyl-tRNA hydrolase [Stenomitos sp.]
MKVVVGLGNPGKQYEETRHNAGFMVVERLAREWGVEGKHESRFEAMVGEGRVGSEKVILVEPITYMNLSGRSVQKVLHFYKLTPDDLLVVYDDFAIALGQVRVRTSGSAGGHNGISSIIQSLNTQSFPRVRVGVGPLPPGASTTKFVLDKFSKAEAPLLEQGLEAAMGAVELAIKESFTSAMQKYNQTQAPA